MKYIKRIIFICFILSLLTVAGVAAGEVNQTDDNKYMQAEVSADSENQLTAEVNTTGTFYELSNLINNTDEKQTLELDNNYESDSTYYEGISINKSLTIDGKGHNIDGLSSSRIFNITNSQIILKNIIFTNAYSNEYGGAVFLNNSTAEIINCTFNLNTAENGGAVYALNSNLTIAESTFTNNEVSALYSEGGAVSSLNANVTVLNSEFYNNSADAGGAMALIFSKSHIINCTFSNNLAYWYGGALISDYLLNITSSRFNMNKAGFKGGAIHSTYYHYIDDSQIIINTSTFFNNSAEYGGAISEVNYLHNYIYNSCFDSNYAVCGAAFARLGKNSVTFTNATFKNNNAVNGTAIYSPSQGNIALNRCNFTENSGQYGCLVYSIQGRVNSHMSTFVISFNSCSIADNYAEYSLIYSLFGNILINNTSLTYNNKQYPFFAIYNSSAGNMVYENNLLGSEESDFDKLLNANNTPESSDSTYTSDGIDEGCASVVMQINENYTVMSFRRDSTSSVMLSVGGINGELRQEKFDGTYFLHVIITDAGWVIGNGGIDCPYTDEKIEAISKKMIKNNNISYEAVETILNLKIADSWGHYIIKAPDGRYGLADYYKKGNDTAKGIETGVLKSGEYILLPNDYRLHRQGNISDLNISDYVTASRYIAATDTYGSTRTTIQTYEYKKEIIDDQIVSSVDVYVSNDDGHLANVSGSEIYLNDIFIYDKYIFGEDIPIVMDGMYVTTLTISAVNLTKTNITSGNIQTVYNKGKYLTATLYDLNGNAIENAEISISLNGKIYTKTTNNNGQVKLFVSLAANNYKSVISFAGNNEYAKSSVNVTIIVKKAAVKITAKKKTFKAKTKVKKYTVKLKNNVGKKLKKVKITLKVKGKTFKAKTNAKGKATFKITNLKKKKTFKATVTYKGNSNYKKVSKTVKIKCK